MASPFGVFLARKISDTALNLLFVIILSYTAFHIFRQSLGNPAKDTVNSLAPCHLESTGRLIWTWPCARVMVIGGIAAGFISGLLGIAGGFIIVPVLKRGTDLETQSVVSTSLAVIALVSSVGVMFAATIGTMNWQIALPFASGAIVAMLLVNAFADRLKGPKLEQGFAIFTGYIAAGMLIKVISAIFK